MRAFLIVLSGLSLNEQEDCSLLNLEKRYKLNIPTLREMGLFKCAGESEEFLSLDASFGQINTNNFSIEQQISQIIDDDCENNFDTFSNVIPESILDKIKQIFRCRILYGKRGDFHSAIKECGASAKNYGYPIVYTNENESVLKIAVHESSFKEDDFFDLIEILSNEIKDYNIQTIEGKIFAGDVEFYKTQHNKIIKKRSCNSQLLKEIQLKQIKRISIGKVLDNICEDCFDENYPSKTDSFALKTLERVALKKENQFVYTYLTDYEKIYSVHGDLLGARVCLENIDETISKILKFLKGDDLLILTSVLSTQLNNSKAPLLVYRADNKQNSSDLGNFEDYKIINEIIKQSI